MNFARKVNINTFIKVVKEGANMKKRKKILDILKIVQPVLDGGYWMTANKFFQIYPQRKDNWSEIFSWLYRNTQILERKPVKGIVMKRLPFPYSPYRCKWAYRLNAKEYAAFVNGGEQLKLAI